MRIEKKRSETNVGFFEKLNRVSNYFVDIHNYFFRTNMVQKSRWRNYKIKYDEKLFFCVHVCDANTECVVNWVNSGRCVTSKTKNDKFILFY